MLNDKHINQYAECLIDKTSLENDIVRGIPDEIWNVIREMYKKGYEDGLEHGLRKGISKVVIFYLRCLPFEIRRKHTRETIEFFLKECIEDSLMGEEVHEGF